MTDKRYRRLRDRKAGFGRRVLLPLFVCLAVLCGGCVLRPPYRQETENGFFQADASSREQDTSAGTDNGNGSGAVPAADQPVPESEISSGYIYVCGEVVHPGVYEIHPDMRLYEGIELAGGFTGEADREFLNLAGPVSDGMQIRVPSVEETRQQAVSGGSDPAGACQDPAVEQAWPSDGQETSGKIDLNTASKEELMTLPGVGPARAEAILSYREQIGGFRQIEQICEVSGIKQATFMKFKDFITVSSGLK